MEKVRGWIVFGEDPENKTIVQVAIRADEKICADWLEKKRLKLVLMEPLEKFLQREEGLKNT